ncbi:MAG TPA: hypothetical protein VGK37_00375 [Casimicrobiaceae bacterium]
MPIQRKLDGANRVLAFVLAFVWLAAAISAIVSGVTRMRPTLVVLGVLALGYAVLWMRVAATRRLLTWSELAVPWRRR